VNGVSAAVRAAMKSVFIDPETRGMVRFAYRMSRA